MRQKTRVVLIILIILIGLLTIMSGLLSNAVELPLEVKRLAWPLLLLVTVALVGLAVWQFWLQAGTKPSVADTREKRQIILDGVQTKWITGFLENELYYDELLSLALRARTSRSGSPIQNPLDQAHALPPSTTITQVFDQARSRLLILGDAGAGKTTLLLELARDLLQQAKNNEDAPIPVVLTLASWAVKQSPLEQWVVEELRTKYDISPKVGKVWVETSQLLLLLDGFDEVAPSAQPACIEAVSSYAAQANRPLVVCSGTKEYLDQPGRFSSLHTVVSIQPLSPQQIENYLSTWGEDGSRLKLALHQNEALRNFVVTPLLLKVLSLAYLDKSEQEVLTLVETTPADQLHRLFHDYVEQMLRRIGARVHVTAQQTKHWLAWLARQMTVHHQSELYLEQLQSDWLPDQNTQAWYRRSLVLVFGLGSGLIFGLGSGLIFGLANGLITSLITGLVFWRLFGRDAKIRPTEVITWVRENRRSYSALLLFLLLPFLLLFFLAFQQFYGGVGGLVIGLSFWLLIFLIVISQGVKVDARVHSAPNQGIWLSARNGLIFGLIAGLVFGLANGLSRGPLDGLIFGLGSGLFLGLAGGLDAFIKHFILRFWLWQARCTPAPRRYIAFLNDAKDQLLLRKVGGGYIFRHRLLRDYFASLETSSSEEASASASLQKLGNYSAEDSRGPRRPLRRGVPTRIPSSRHRRQRRRKET